MIIKHKTYLGILLLLLTSLPLSLRAATTPDVFLYEGRLLSSANTAITAPVVFRFSLWKSDDWTPGDKTGDAINTGSANYGGWTEAQTVTPTNDGVVSMPLGRSVPLPAIVYADHRYLQVEVKPQGSPDSAYKLMDPTGDAGADTDDRKLLASVPYAKNAESLQEHGVGTGSGNILLLGSGGMISDRQAGKGTAAPSFAIDAHDEAASEVALKFGESLAKTLIYDKGNSRFAFNDSLRVEGDLTVTGLINGIDISSLGGGPSNGPLQVSSGAGLTVHIAAGGYRINGTVTQYPGATVPVTDNADNYLYFTGTGFVVGLGGFPTNVSSIPLAKVTVSGGAVFRITDMRVLQSDDREKSVTHVFRPSFDGVAFQADGTDNVGQLSELHDPSGLRNCYNWQTTKTAVQDYDVILRVALPSAFARWQDVPLRVSYQTDTAASADNALDIHVFDTANQPVTLSGAATGLAATAWTVAEPGFTGAPAWNPGQTVVLKFTVKAKAGSSVRLGDVELRYVELTK
jgi:hypothetical protein